MGAVVNDVPVARQSRDPARPQAGESLLEHQKYSPLPMVGDHKKVISYFLRNSVASVTPFPVSAVLPPG